LPGTTGSHRDVVAVYERVVGRPLETLVLIQADIARALGQRRSLDANGGPPQYCHQSAAILEEFS
jgi:hypothetical protein